MDNMFWILGIILWMLIGYCGWCFEFGAEGWNEDDIIDKSDIALLCLLFLLGPTGFPGVILFCFFEHKFKFVNPLSYKILKKFWKIWRYNHPTKGEFILRKFGA